LTGGAGTPPNCSVTILNKGGTEGIIKEKRTFVFLRDPKIMKYTEGGDVVDYMRDPKMVDFEPVMMVADRRSFPANAGFERTAEASSRLNSGEVEWCVSCDLTYEDRNGNRRQTAFLWVWDVTHAWFKPEPNENASYED
jgi:hypothetical protein